MSKNTGSYATVTSQSMPWLNTPPLQEKKTKGRKIRAPPTIVNPVFERCADLTDDPFWKKIFAEASQGKFTRGFSYRNGQLSHKRGTKIQKIQISDSPVEALTTCLDFFKTAAGLRSAIDQERERQQIEEQLLESYSANNMTWMEIRKKKKNLPGLYISTFIRTVGDSMGLSEHQRKQLTTVINIGLLLGYLSDEAIEFDGAIRGIQGLSYNEEKKEFVLDIQGAPPKIRLKTVPDAVLLDPNSKSMQTSSMNSVSFIDLWEKFLEGLNEESQNSASLCIADVSSMDESSIMSVEYY